MKRQSLLAATIAMATIVTGLAHAEPIKTARTIYGVDVATAGISGIRKRIAPVDSPSGAQ